MTRAFTSRSGSSMLPQKPKACRVVVADVTKAAAGRAALHLRIEKAEVGRHIGALASDLWAPTDLDLDLYRHARASVDPLHRTR